MNFTKMHGLGNDFIVIAGCERLPDDASKLAVGWCDRHFGIGADGVVFLLPSERADLMMRIMNADGSEAEQCGNAIRCAAKYAYDSGLAAKTVMTIETIGAGVQTVVLQVRDGKAESVRVDMGEPVLDGLAIPTTLDLKPVADQPIIVDGAEFRFTAVSMGNPHCVIFVDDAAGFDLHRWGPKLERHPFFPKRVNVEFATVNTPSQIDMRVWERGAGPTLACGTGACATLVASVINGKSNRRAVVSLKGGDLEIEWNENDNRVYMTGPAATVFSGTLV
jgi:diaminopimelate epimerase